jgi:hypothetical protein
MDFKTITSLVSVALVFAGYGSYIRDIIKRKVVPHTFTFLILGLASSITWALQVSGGAGVGAWITFWVGATCTFIFFLSLKYGEKSITRLDVFFLILALVALFLWLVVDQPVWSVILVVLTALLGFGPTVRKSWHKPFQESLFTWWVAALRHGLGIIALEQFNLLTLLYPVAWTAANIAFCVALIARRRKVKQNNPQILAQER